MRIYNVDQLKEGQEYEERGDGETYLWKCLEIDGQYITLMRNDEPDETHTLDMESLQRYLDKPDGHASLFYITPPPLLDDDLFTL